MKAPSVIGIAASLCVLVFASCRGPVKESADQSAPIEITAVELHKAYAADAMTAGKRFNGKTLLITGDVKMATPMFTGYTMTGPITVPDSIYFKTEVDYLPHDIKYVVCRGDFTDHSAGAPGKLNPRVKVGETLTVRCDPAEITWSDPGLYIAHCILASP